MEHSIFLRQVIDSNGFLQEIPQGPRSKQKKMPKKMKRSARTKAMLAPPAQKRSSCEPCTAEKRQAVAPAPNPWEVEAFLPGLPHEPNLLPVVSCVGAHRSDTSSQSCWATTKSGGRCMRKRVAGNFCQQHFNEISAQKQQMAFFEEVEDLFDGARDKWEKEQVELAKALSLEDDAEKKAQRLESARRVERRLRIQNLRRVVTPAEGECLFVAVAWSAGLAVDRFAFRQQVVSYLSSFPHYFGRWFDTKWKSFQQYLLQMAKPSTWGDDLCLVAMSHLLLRPIVLITDRSEESEAIMTVEPPSSISQEAWGEPIYFSYLGFSHYEATEDLPVKKELS